MLQELKVENYAIIEHLDIAFYPGLNIITGETGAGKSILLGALSLLGGAKADPAVIRTGAHACIIEGTFGIGEYRTADLETILADNDLDYSDTITIRRMISNNGKSRAFIDDVPVNLTVLRAVADRLVDIHSQHQTLLLAGTGFQTRLVDGVAGHDKAVQQYAADYKKLRELDAELDRAEKAASDAIKERDYLQYQLDQLLDLKLRKGETAELEQEQNRLTHAEEIAAVLNECVSVMTDDDYSLNAKVKNMGSQLQKLAQKYAPAEELAGRMASVFLELKDLAAECESKRDQVEINPKRLEEVNERLDAIYHLCQKHNLPDGENLLALQEELDNKLQAFGQADERIGALKKEIVALEATAALEAAAISKGRTQAAGEIKTHVEQTLNELGISGAVFEVQISPAETLTPTGADRIQMRFSGNKGSEPQPIEQVASGGEMSRVMLALKGLVAQRIQLPTIIFDEIDQGVSGRVADKMGEIIARMGNSMQVLNITHLPQVAAKGEHHYHVSKDDSGTRMRKLKAAERHEHIATMLSGNQITEAARKQAAELLKSSTNNRN